MDVETLFAIKPEILPGFIPSIIYFIIFALILMVSGIYLVRSLSKIARFLGLSEFSAAFIIMSFASSIPELLLGITSALNQSSSLSLGNVIGANIMTSTLVAGIIILTSKGIKIKSQKIGKSAYFMLASIIVLITLFIIGKELSRIDGFILLILFGFNTYYIFKKRIKYKQKLKSIGETQKKFKYLIIFLIALIGLFISSNFVIHYASGVVYQKY